MSNNPPSRSGPDRDGPPRIALAPDGAPGWMHDAVVAGGGHIVPVGEAEGLVWAAPRSPDALVELLDDAPGLSWVQLPFAGIEQYVDLLDDDHLWTCAKGVYAEPVAEMALSLALAGLRNLGPYARATSWTGPAGRNLIGANVAILGGGGITNSLLRMLAPFDCHTTVVRNHVAEMDGADEVLEADRYVDALAGADLVVLALALTPDTEGMISRSELQTMESHAWIVNVARGRHIVTEDLVWALENEIIGGAGLDVTDPEPLPDGHRLWSLSNCIITPHCGNTPAMAAPLLSERISTNVHRFAHGEPLIGEVYVDLGY
ncbi:MAG: D-isomer specific 2-hydroxyacid dehydrogenase family protein [Ilumatobacteraceae bacterium]